MDKNQILTKLQDVAIPIRYLKLTRNDFVSGFQIAKMIPEWIHNGEVIAFTGNHATEFLAVVGKVIVFESDILTKWVNYSDLAVSYRVYDEDGRTMMAYYKVVPVLLIADAKFGDPAFDLAQFLKERYGKQLATFLSVFGIFYPASVPFVKSLEVKKNV
jgi:hypothetical protein